MTAVPLAADTHQRCTRCHRRHPELLAATDCPVCGGLLELRPASPPVRGRELAARFDERLCVRAGPEASGVWRFAELVLPGATARAVSWPEGNTPLLARAPVTRWAGVDELLLKHEGMNPTGSFKDRGMTAGVTQALRVGATAVACASTGNTGASMAAYAALAGLPALVIIPRGRIATGKLAQTIAHGARTLLVRGDFDDCLRLAREAAASLGVYLLNSINPVRIAGQKTIALELLQQLGWEAPDWIAVPAGNLGNTAAIGVALEDAHALGLIARVPRLIAVQAAGAAPFAMSFWEGFRVRHRVKATTVASAIRIGDPASYHRAVNAIRATDGIVTAVSDDAILEAKAVIDAAGVGCEPASAASVAGIRQLVRAGIIAPGSRVAAVLTGHVLKDAESVVRYHQETEPPPPGANRPLEIEPEVAEIERAISGSAASPRR